MEFKIYFLNDRQIIFYLFSFDPLKEKQPCKGNLDYIIYRQNENNYISFIHGKGFNNDNDDNDNNSSSNKRTPKEKKMKEVEE